MTGLQIGDGAIPGNIPGPGSVGNQLLRRFGGELPAGQGLIASGVLLPHFQPVLGGNTKPGKSAGTAPIGVEGDTCLVRGGGRQLDSPSANGIVAAERTECNIRIIGLIQMEPGIL